jgi:predicted ATP-grasp superfamily ATP-dependent carboligase
MTALGGATDVDAAAAVTREARPAGALLLGADYRALAVARSLGRHGVRVCVLREPDEPLAAASRYAECSMAWPVGGEAARLGFLLRLAESEGLQGWALIPTADETAALVARHHERLGRHFVHTTPAWESLRWAYDKRLTYALAERIGVPCPRTALARTPAEAAAVETPFPAVLKPAVKVSLNRFTAAKAWRVDSRCELLARYAEACTLVDPDILMVQELIPGGGEAQFSFTTLCADGEPLATLTARRTRQYPADFGRASTFVETIDCHELVAPSLRLLREIRFTGLIEVEYKRDPRDNVMKVLDMNPRVWGWHSLCPRAGVDFSYLLWLFTSGQPIPPTRARPGVGWIRLSTDTPTALKELIAGRLSARDYLRSLGCRHESAIFAWDDPLPGLCELPLIAYALCRRRLRRHGK